MELPDDQMAVLHVVGSLGEVNNPPRAGGIARLCGHGDDGYWASYRLQILKNWGLVVCSRFRWSLTEKGRLALNPRGDGGVSDG